MTGFLVGLVVGIFIGIEDLGEPVPYQTVTYIDSSKIVKVYNTSAFKYRYMPNTYAVGWNTNDYRYWETREPRPIIRKRIVINKKPKPKPVERKE